jgi:uncharacterized protein YcgI (DUF1989 family)
MPSQVCDFWCFATDNVRSDGTLITFMSMHHSHDAIRKHIPAPGDVLVTSQSKPILALLEDSGPGVHDTTVAACSHELYEGILGIGPDDHHDSCTANLHAALKAQGYKLTDDPLNFYTPRCVLSCFLSCSCADSALAFLRCAARSTCG